MQDLNMSFSYTEKEGEQTKWLTQFYSHEASASLFIQFNSFRYSLSVESHNIKRTSKNFGTLTDSKTKLTAKKLTSDV